MTSVVIAAHNEAAVIERCLASLLADATPGEFDVIVVANGCTDDTATLAARSPGVRVVEIPEASKPKALNAGDTIAAGFPRVYLDADIVAGTHVVRAMRDALAADAPQPVPLAVVPRRDLELTGRSFLVRQFFAINSRLPVFHEGLFGRGLIALSAEGRRRFDRFPDMVADDLFLDSQFTPQEKREVDGVSTVVEVPLHTRDLVRRLVRVRRGNASLRAAGRSGTIAGKVRPVDRFAWLRDVVIPNPRLVPAGVVYAGITSLAALLALRTPTEGQAWGRDESTRRETTADD
ncbi:glycosyltransferase [Rhodococcus sp. NPDC003383]